MLFYIFHNKICPLVNMNRTDNYTMKERGLAVRLAVLKPILHGELSTLEYTHT